MENKFGFESSNLKTAFPLILLEEKKICVISPSEMERAKGKENLFKVAGSLLVQILKIQLNAQSHKTLNERKEGENVLFLYSLKKTQKDRWPKWEGLWSDETLIIFFCFNKGKHVVNCVMTLFSQEKGQQRGEKDA